MNANAQVLSSMTSRQKLSAGILVLIVMGILWQAYGMFSGKFTLNKSAHNQNAFSVLGSSSPKMLAANTPQANMQPQEPQPSQAQLPSLADQSGMTDREKQLMALQQQTQAKYLQAVNELQMLKVTKDIWEANQAIMTARLSTISSEKQIVDMLEPTATPTPASASAQGTTTAMHKPAVSYTVVSVSQVRGRWSAVLNSAGNLYNVSIGDVMPSDGSSVVGIDRTGVTLDLNGDRKKYTLVPII